jgi:chromosomal replication initiator protein
VTTPSHPHEVSSTHTDERPWDLVLDRIRQKVNEQTYQTWFSPMECTGIEEGLLRLRGPNQFFVDWLTEHHLELLQESANQILGDRVQIEIDVDPNPSLAEVDSSASGTLPEDDPAAVSARPRPVPRSAGLNPRYTFQNFVIGENNQFAAAACMAVADQPASTYNPLFLYGGVGLGKTHLMQAIGARILEDRPQTVVHYVSAENFMNEMIQSIRDRTTFEFKNRYRNVDLLLIDDIQFLAGKESTQQEFFHTFNALYDANKQIVVTSDRLPKEISALEERLRSRFEWGLITDIQTPNFETRIAILEKKIEKEEILIPDDVLVFVAENIENNIRELEGAVIRLLAFASLTGSTIDVPMAQHVLKAFHHRSPARPDLTMAEIIREVSSTYRISIDLLRSKTRTKQVAHARQMAMYICREHTRSSLNQIGLKFGGRDHTTVHHAWQKIGALVHTDDSVREEYEDLLERLRHPSSGGR